MRRTIRSVVEHLTVYAALLAAGWVLIYALPDIAAGIVIAVAVAALMARNVWKTSGHYCPANHPAGCAYWSDGVHRCWLIARDHGPDPDPPGHICTCGAVYKTTEQITPGGFRP
jgi:hypothetical protein